MHTFFWRCGAVVLLSACSQPELSVQRATNPAIADAAPLGGEVTLAQVQAAIAASGVAWQAGVSTLSTLSLQERVMMLGAQDVARERVRIVETAEAASPLPAILDWRNLDGVSYVSPVLDQGRCGSCVAFATIATFETQLNIAAKDPSSPFQLSPQYLFSCGGGGCGSGWNVSPAARFLQKTGVPDDSCMPYASGAHGDDAKCKTACADVKTRVLKISASTRPTRGSSSVAAVKDALTKGPLIATMTVYEDFFFYASGVYKHVTGGVAGGHAVSIVGWNDADQAWIVRNSWGADWGMAGFFEIAWNDASGVGEETWGLEVPAPGPYVAFADLRDGDLLSGTQTLTFDARELSADLSWTLHNGAQQITQGASATFDTTQVPDGVYTLRPHAGTVTGAARTISILNGTVTGNVDFVALKNGQTLKGTALFDVALRSAPVPLTLVSWTISDATGKQVVVRSSDNTGPVMELGWDTTKWPNGTYVINVVGAAGTQQVVGATRTITVKN